MKVTGRFYYGWIIVAGAFLGYSCFSISRHLFPYVLSNMGAELNLAHESMGNISSVYFFAYTIMTFVWGIIADRIGPKKCMLIGQVSILVGLSGMGFMSSLPVGFLFYALCGAGAAGQSIPVVRLLSDWFGGARRGTALGLSGTGASVITVVLGVVVPIILVSYSWRWCWWTSAAFVLIIAVICWLLLVNTPAERGLTHISAEEHSVSPGEQIKENHQTTAPKGTIRDMMKRGTVWNLAALYFTRGIGYAIFMTFAVAYLEEVGWGVKAAAGVLATWGALSLAGHIIWGVASDRITKKYLLAAALALKSIGLFVFLGGSTIGGYVGAAMVGFGGVGIPTVLAAAMADYYEPTVIGTIFGFITLAFGVGAIIGPTLGGALADATGTLLTAIVLALAAVIVSFVLALILKKPPQGTCPVCGTKLFRIGKL